MSSTIGQSNQYMGLSNTIQLDKRMSSVICMIWATCGGDKDDNQNSTTELDTHANMCVVGDQAIVFHTGRTA